jgi:hypothetical protein
LPEAGGAVTAKVVRVENGGMGVAFPDDDSVRVRIKHAIRELPGRLSIK